LVTRKYFFDFISFFDLVILPIPCDSGDVDVSHRVFFWLAAVDAFLFFFRFGTVPEFSLTLLMEPNLHVRKWRWLVYKDL
jgi:hypothetical protein